MHLTFVSSEGLEQSAISILASSSESGTTSKNTMMEPVKKYFSSFGGEGGEESESDSEFLVVDENSPLLLDLDPPGTTRTSYMGDHGWGRKSSRSLLTFRISKKEKNQRLPWVIVLTALGMAAMVLVGFISMFQDTSTVTDFTNNDVSNMINVTELPASTNIDPPTATLPPIPNDAGSGSPNPVDSILSNNSSSPIP